jgi:hypothetical protein
MATEQNYKTVQSLSSRVLPISNNAQLQLCNSEGLFSLSVFVILLPNTPYDYEKEKTQNISHKK